MSPILTDAQSRKPHSPLFSQAEPLSLTVHLGTDAFCLLPARCTGVCCAQLSGLTHPCMIPLPWRRFTCPFQFSSVAQSCPTLCDPMNRSTPGLPVHHQLPEFTQTQVHRVSDAIQPSHPWSSPSPPAPNPSQHQSLFQ